MDASDQNLNAGSEFERAFNPSQWSERRSAGAWRAGGDGTEL